MYCDRRIVSSPATKCSALTAHLSLVEERVRTLMYSRMKLSGYRTERPIFTYRGPTPLSLALASQERLTRNRRAASVARDDVARALRWRDQRGGPHEAVHSSPGPPARSKSDDRD